MTCEPLFAGVGVALVTIFDEWGSVDYRATAELGASLVELGVSAVVVCGSTGEAGALTADERARLIQTVRATVPDGTLIAGTGAPSAAQAAELTRAASDQGADGVLVLSPPGSRDPRGYYGRVAGATSQPVLAYHYPAASSPGLAVDMLARLPVHGLKDSSGDVGRLFETLDAFSGWLYVGSANLVATAASSGCAGAILAVANACPELACDAFRGAPDAQRELARTARRLLVDGPRSLKSAVAERFGTSTSCRMG